MSLVLMFLAFIEIIFMKREGRFFVLIIMAMVSYLKSIVHSDYIYWDLILTLIISAFVLSRFKINHKGV